MSEGEVTLGELDRRMTAGFAAIHQRLAELAYVPREVYNAEIRELRDDIKELKDSKRWTSRALVSAFIYPLLVAAVIALVVTR